MENYVVEVEFETVDQLPGGRVVLPLEAPGNFTWQIVKGHMEEPAQVEMRDLMRKFIIDGRWVQNWGQHRPRDQDPPDAHRPTVPETGQVEVAVRIVDKLPAGKTVDFEEAKGCFAWFVLKGNITKQACAEMEAQMQYLNHNGQWIQNWTDEDESPR